MRITPLDIRKQEFRKTMRGLDAEEVYAFLATVADEYEAVLNDNKALKERLLELDDKVQEYRNMEQTLRNTLLTAERVNVEAKENARREADLIIKEAQIEAEKAFRNIKKEAMELRNTIQDLKRQKEQYLSRLRMLISSHLKFVETAQKDFTEDDRVVDRLVNEAEKGERSLGARHEIPRPAKNEPSPPQPPRPKMEHPGLEAEPPHPGSEVQPRCDEPPRPKAKATPTVTNEPSRTNEPAGASEHTLTNSPARTADQAVASASPPADAPAAADEQPAAPGSPDTDSLPELDEILERMAETQKSALQADVNRPAQANGTETPRTKPAPSSSGPAPAAPPPQAQSEPPVRAEQPVQAGANESKEHGKPAKVESADSEEEWSLEKLKKDIMSSGPRGNEGV